jgi:DMSO/TMAO reductase YedYZ molybdopterin-dependent catalytic subunit
MKVLKRLKASASADGLSRRRFLALVAGSSGALLAACSQPSASPPAPTSAPAAAPPKPSPPPAAAAPSPSPAASPAAAAPEAVAPVAGLIDKPIPEAYFVPLGSNAEMRFEVMAGPRYTTPSSAFFVRDHQASVKVDLKSWKLSIEGSGVEKPFSLTYDDLVKLPARTVTRYLECAGNGRSFYQTLLNRPAQGGQWRLGAYGIAEWTGVPMSELLNRAGLKQTAREVMPVGLDQPRVRRPMPIEKAMEDDTLVAYLMNGGPLGVDHGFPARVLAPGWIGVASVKWLGSIQVTEEHNAVPWNTDTYVLIGPDYQPQPPAQGPAINEQVLKSAVALPWPAALPAGAQTVRGYAWSPAGKVAKVEVSLDGGGTYAPARLTEPNVERAGVRWEFTFDARPGDLTITPRATDEKGNTQPDLSQQKWNQQGYIFAAPVPHPVKVSG